MNPSQEAWLPGSLPWAAPFTVPTLQRGWRVPAAALWGPRKQEHEGIYGVLAVCGGL